MGRIPAPRIAAAADLVLLLPARERLRGTLDADPALARVLSRADRLADGAAGRDAQLLRHVDLLPRRVPAAALTRALDAADADQGGWLRADPAWLRADLSSGRMMACGELGLSQADADALLKPLKPLFGDEGFPISAPVPQRWYLQLPRETRLPPMSSPEEALGDDLHGHLPAGDDGRRWRRLLNEAQVLLHNHPLNAERTAAGLPPVNSVWFWGGGVLPDRVGTPGELYTDDPVLQAIGRLAGKPSSPLAALVERAPAERATALIDLRVLRDVAQLAEPWLPWALQRLQAGRHAGLQFDFADGCVFRYRSAHRWRWWRRKCAIAAEPRR